MAVVYATIKNRITHVPDDVELICNNPTDVIEIEFDEEWSGKTGYVARFEWNGKYYDVPFEGNRVKVPELSNTTWIMFGVYADNITAAPVKVKCKKSILCYGSGERNVPANPFYDEFVERLENVEKAVEHGGGGSGGISEEKDPTVPAWAKAAEKPKYTADEVGAASKEAVERLSEEIAEQGENIAPVIAVKELFEDAVIIRGQSNIFYPAYVYDSRYDYNTGKVYNGASTAVRNVNPIPVSGNTPYSYQEFINPKLNASLFLYDADGVIIGEHMLVAGFAHFVTPPNAASMNFHIASWTTKHPGVEPQVMIWKTDSDASLPNFIPYNPEASVEGVILPKLQVTKYEKDAENILAMKKALFDGSFNYIAYSKIDNDGGSINTAEHFVHCAKLPFDMLKGDVRPTADGGVIMCHDAGFTLNDNGDIVSFNADNCTLIANLTEAECLALKHAATGNRVCNLETFLRICKKYGKVAYITIRDEHIADVVAPVMMGLLDKYRMRTRCVVNSFDVASLQAVRNLDEHIMLSRVCYFANGTEGISKAFVDAAIALGNCRVAIFCFSSSSEDVTVLDNSAEAIAYAIENDVRVDCGQVGAGIGIDDVLARGVVGAQMVVAPDLN